MRTFGIQLDLIAFWIFSGIIEATGPNSEHSLHFSADIFVSQLSVLVRGPQLEPHLFSCGCVCGRPLWKPPGLWSRPAAPPSGRSPRGRCPSGYRWSHFCCSWAGPRYRDACGPCSSPGSPAGDRDSWLSTLHSRQNKGENQAAVPLLFWSQHFDNIQRFCRLVCYGKTVPWKLETTIPLKNSLHAILIHFTRGLFIKRWTNGEQLTTKTAFEKVKAHVHVYEKNTQLYRSIVSVSFQSINPVSCLFTSVC